MPPPPKPIDQAEDLVVRAIAERTDELVDLACALIRFDTTNRGRDSEPARDEAKLQGHLAEILEGAGAETEVWEPPRSSFGSGLRQLREEVSFDGRPQLRARFPGTGGGRSLLFNGHIDVVTAEPRDQWTSDPNEPEVRGGRLYGRGACDMKGGVAAMVIAATAISQLGLRLDGDLIVNTVTDEEWNGAGTLASADHGVRADGGIAPEATNFDAWTSCRGIRLLTIVVPGRTGDAEIPQPDWRHGGAVNAIEKTMLVVDSIRLLREDWRRRFASSHPELAPGELVPTVIQAGDWWVSYPADCKLTVDVTYLPVQADPQDGWSTELEKEVEAWILERSTEDPWLAENPPELIWGTDLPPAAVSPTDPVVTHALAAGAKIGRTGKPIAFHSWHDAATFSRLGTPSISYGPSPLSEDGEDLVHKVDESVRVDDLVQCAQALASTALRYTAAG